VITLEYRYVGDDPVMQKICRGRWRTWMNYDCQDDADQAMYNQRRKYDFYEFRTREIHDEH